MPTWLTEIFNALTKNLGGAKGYLARKILEYGGQLLMDWWNKQKQKKTETQVQKDIDQAKPRDEETRKNELENLNS